MVSSLVQDENKKKSSDMRTKIDHDKKSSWLLSGLLTTNNNEMGLEPSNKNSYAGWVCASSQRCYQHRQKFC